MKNKTTAKNRKNDRKAKGSPPGTRLLLSVPESFAESHRVHPIRDRHTDESSMELGSRRLRPANRTWRISRGSTEILGQPEIPWPDKPEKIEQFHRTCAPLYKRAEHNRRESRTLSVLREGLPPKLVGPVAGVEHL